MIKYAFKGLCSNFVQSIVYVGFALLIAKIGGYQATWQLIWIAVAVISLVLNVGNALIKIKCSSDQLSKVIEFMDNNKGF
ncbi:hypothetical protein [Weissella minor]|uniref:Uncharacterized protein n=1 Tax=Weissella minor TaxID=1620 RepID=A0A0R2JJR2_9LACO|nr:hypothetical protein [Weissella minor]KRN77480.1 hypothetical protein IV67_GL001535 [Weissella minor]